MRRHYSILLAALGLTLALAMQAQAHPEYGCKSCHVPHGGAGDNTQVPLWEPTNYGYTLVITGNYGGSASLNATVGAPDGASKLCLGCHDGGNGSHVDAAHKFGTGDSSTYGKGGLLNSHPVSFVYDAALVTADKHLKDPATLDNDVLDASGKMQCTSCHQVHKHADRQDIANLRWAYPCVEPEGTVANSFVNGLSISYLFCTHCHAK